jgi:hypothetical protein
MPSQSKENEEAQGKRDTEGRPVVKVPAEKQRQENEGTEDPADPQDMGDEPAG